MKKTEGRGREIPKGDKMRENERNNNNITDIRKMREIKLYILKQTLPDKKRKYKNNYDITQER